ncbi:uncharacterized protein METZ01_LOCUS442626, partial [marine metagenome]
KEFDASVFAWQSVKSDSQLPPSEKLSFSPELAWQSVFKEGLGLALSNSFLIHASYNKSGCLGKRALAYHYSTNRSKEYCKETLFTADSSGQVLVTSNLLAPTRNKKSLESVIKFVHPKPNSYTRGKPLSLDFIEVVSKDGWDIDQVGFFLARYITVLRQLLKGSDFTGTLSKKQDKLPGTFFDVIPQNIIIQSDGQPVIIDPEWELVEDIELGMCLFRSILLMLADLTRIGNHAEGREFSRIEFIKEGCLSAGIFIYET